ncbi:S8 family serine peptidase [Hymenobacter sp. IS2118]|uniref:S8 family serine peptidase n=1 Tax=Hymenobacter sp. IS2118 TaxID=1505605 RepID=UPI0005559B75|nr:S8 family serine peptidase [Hymenobacter sp. IS2118]
MKKNWVCLWVSLGLLAGAEGACAQRPAAAPATRYWVTLSDKKGVSFDPRRYFSPQAQARRQRQQLPAFEASDLPVRPDYLAGITAVADTVTLVSRWFNAVACRATPRQAAALQHLPGVASVVAWPQAAGAIAARQAGASLEGEPTTPLKPISANDYLLARRQTAHLDGPALRAAGLEGHGVRIAVFDVGFRGLLAHPAFQELVKNKQIIATRDFLRNRDDVYQSGSHGTEVMGCLAGRLPAAAGGAPGPALGLAPAAGYLLARTEQLGRERYAEEEAWLAAAEWADRLGADIISSSLAYTEQRYFPEQMNGRRSLVSRAANLAARKGMLVVSAAGNDGDNDWVRIGTPADADSVLAVGGLDPETGLHVDFSSYGPTADRRPKPNLAAFGIVLTTTPRGYERLEGTSFSAPLLAGFAACLRQQNKEATAMELFRTLEKSGELFPYFDYAHGYGRPRYQYTSSPGRPVTAAAPGPTFDFIAHDSLVAVVIRPEAALRPADLLPMLVEQSGIAVQVAFEGLAESQIPARALPLPVGQPVPLPLPEPNYPPYLYWNLADRRGVLHRYETRAVTQRLVVQVPRRLLQNGEVLKVHFKGYTGTYSE